eukprot:1620710-Pleurochrysis_carterae.AAC.1
MALITLTTCMTAAVRSRGAVNFLQPVSKRSSSRPVSMASVSGIVYSAPEQDPKVRLFTKEGCTLCDVAKKALVEVRDEHPHTLEAVDITDEGNRQYWDKYKYDIPVLHIADKYWAKHRKRRALCRITAEDAAAALAEARTGEFVERRGEPDAARLERKS